ncbi:cytochrome P450 93A3-like protein [Tanacetum coccineum]
MWDWVCTPNNGPVYRLYLGYVPCVVICSPEAAKEILKTSENSFLNRPQNNSALAYLTYGFKDLSFVDYGPYWTFTKKIVMSQLLNGAKLDLFLKVRQDEINSFIKSLSRIAKVGMAVDLGGELVKVSNNVISRMAMREGCSDNENEAKKGFRKMSKDTRGRFDALIERIMKEHEEVRKCGTREVKDLLDVLLHIEQDKSLEIDWTRENIKALILNLFAGGTDTSANTVEWAMASLINHPNVMTKATQEIDQVVGKNRLLQESDIQKLPYLQSIVKETLRLYPSASLIPRQSTKDCVVGGYHIPAKTNIFVNLWAVGRDPKYWEDPLEFIPERFQSSELDVKGQHFHLLPFGSGRRMCPGMSLALQVIQTTLGATIQCFEWKARKDGKLANVDMEEGLVSPFLELILWFVFL